MIGGKEATRFHSRVAPNPSPSVIERLVALDHGLDVADELDGEMILVAVVVKVFLDPVITIEQLVAGHG